MALRWALCALVCGAVACGDATREPSPPSDIVVLLQSDLTPGFELARIEAYTRVDEGTRDNVTSIGVTSGSDWVSAPVEILRLPRDVLADDLEATRTLLIVRGTDRNGGRSMEWRTRLDASSGRIEVRLFRSCRGVFCETGRCLGGRCVPDDCFRGDEESCPTPLCESDGRCAQADPLCRFEGRCDAGVCFQPIDDAPCGANHFCEPGLGCLVEPGRGQANGTACTLDRACASGFCVGGVCCNRECRTCEQCGEGSCAPRASAPTSPSEEVCDGLDNDCDGTVDDLEPMSEANCGACGFPCAAGETCVGPRCTVDMPCERYLGLPCDEVEVGRLTAPRPHPSMRFGSPLALDGDLLAVSAVTDGTRATGIDMAPPDDATYDPDAFYGAVYLYRRVEGSWRFEAALRPPGPPDEVGDGTRYGTYLAVHEDRVAVAAGSTGQVHVYDFDGTAWRGPEVREAAAEVRALAFLDDGRLAVWRESLLDVEEGAGRARVRVGGLRPGTMVAEGDRLALLESSGRLLVGTPQGGLDTLPDPGVRTFASASSPMLLRGSRLFVGRPFGGAPTIIVLSETETGWEPSQMLAADRNGVASFAVVGSWLAVGSPADALTDTPDVVGPDTRIRPGRGERSGTVFLYPLGAGGEGLPIEGPLYLRPSTLPEFADFGRTLVTDGETLFIGAPGDEARRFDGSAALVQTAGAVYLRRLVPAAP